VGFHVRRQDAPGGSGIPERFRAEGLSPHGWANGPGDRYGWHHHPYHKVLFCVWGSITFNGRDAENVTLGPGDRLDIDPYTEHAATVGPAGVECMEAALEEARR
jgi:Cupin domain